MTCLPLRLVKAVLGAYIAGLLFCCVASINTTTGGKNFIVTGGTFSTDLTQARLGYDFYVKYINSLGGIKVGTNNVKYYLQYDNCDDRQNAVDHISCTNQFIASHQANLLDFHFGGGPQFIMNETGLTNAASLLSILCCVGPDAVYNQGFANIFGVQVSNSQYPPEFLRYVTLQGLTSIALVAMSPNVFTDSTCTAARDFAIKYKLNILQDLTYTASATDAEMNAIAAKVSQSDTEALFGCTTYSDGVKLSNALYKNGFFPKAIFLTVAPSSSAFLKDVPLAYGEFFTSVGQWHPKQAGDDAEFGTNAAFVLKFKELMGVEPDYVAAGAVVSFQLLVKSIQRAYATSSHTLGVFNQGDIKYQLRVTKEDTFFGSIAFNAFQRNYAKNPTVMQILAVDTSKGSGASLKATWETDAVLPVGIANQRYIYPIPGSDYVRWGTDASVVSIILAALVVLLGIVLIILIVYYREHPEIKAADWIILCVIVFSSVLLSTTPIYFIGVMNSFLCYFKIWLPAVALTTLFGTMVTKQVRIFLIYYWADDFARLRNAKLNFSFVAKISTVLLGVQVLLLTIGSVLPNAGYVSVRSFCEAGSDTKIFVFMVSFYILLLIMGAVIMGYLTKGANKLFAEQKALTYAAFNVITASLIAVPVVYAESISGSFSLKLRTVAISLATFIVSVGTLIYVVIPKVYKAVNHMEAELGEADRDSSAFESRRSLDGTMPALSRVTSFREVDRASTHARNSSEGTELGYLQTPIESEAGDGPKRSNKLFKRANSAHMSRFTQNLTPSTLSSIPNAVQGHAEEDAQLEATDGQAPSGGGPGYESNGVVVESPPALNCIVVSVQEEIPALPKQTSLTFPPQKL